MSSINSSVKLATVTVDPLARRRKSRENGEDKGVQILSCKASGTGSGEWDTP